MEDINQIPFNFDPRIGLIVGIMVGFLVFAVSLDLKWEKLRGVLKKPKAPAIGLLAQFEVLPAVAFMTGIYLTDAPSIVSPRTFAGHLLSGWMSTLCVFTTPARR